MLSVQPLKKGNKTKQFILHEALHYAKAVGLEGVTIGKLSTLVGMSKGGLAAHFQSKEDLQLNILETASAIFQDTIVNPALQFDQAIERMKLLFKLWLDDLKNEDAPSGCLIINAAFEFNDRVGVVKDYILQILHDFYLLLQELVTLAVEQGYLRPNTDIKQFVFEWQSIVLGYHQYLNLQSSRGLRKRAEVAFDALVERYKA